MAQGGTETAGGIQMPLDVKAGGLQGQGARPAHYIYDPINSFPVQSLKWCAFPYMLTYGSIFKMWFVYNNLYA